MADSSVAVTPGSGATIRILTALGAGSAGQQVITLGDSAGNLLGTTAAPLPVENYDTTAPISIAANTTTSGSVTGVNFGGAANIQITGTFVATVQVQLTADGTNYVNLTGNAGVINISTGSYVAAGNITAPGLYQVSAAGMTGVRVITTAYTSGTVTGTVRVGSAAGMTAMSNIPSIVLGAATAAVGSVFIGASTQSFFNATTTAAAYSSAIKASAGRLQTLTVSNPTATAAYVKLYNATSITLGTTVPVATFRLAATGSAGDTINPNLGPNGAFFSTGIYMAITAAAAATDTAATVAGIQILATYV